MNLETPISALPTVGPTRATRFSYLGLNTVRDLIYYFPFRYEDYSHLKTIAELVPGETVTIKGRVDLVANRRSSFKHKIVTEVLISDDSGSMKIVWFNQPFITKTLKQGDEVYISGEVELDRYGMQFKAPEYEKVRFDGNTVHTARLVPIYHVTAGLTTKQLRFLLAHVLPVIQAMPELLPENMIVEHKLMSLAEALEQIHFPSTQETLFRAQQRLKFDELFILQLEIHRLRAELDQRQAVKISFLEKPTKDFVDSLPFKLTDDQKRSAWEILLDLQKERPMNRLLEGDVGSGKTVVVAIAMANAVRNGFKVVLMAPTEILAHQHYLTLQKVFVKEPFKVAILTRTKHEVNGEVLSKKALLDDLRVGNADIIVGTQALIQENVQLHDLGLVVVDEQHRFGVGQRQALLAKEEKYTPHFLSMTATPIPRSLSLALFGDLDISIIKQMPANRKKIETRLIEETGRYEAYEFIRKQIAEGRQAFVICPLIDPSDTLGVKSVTQEFERLDKEIFHDLKVGLLHGKLKSEEKESVMKQFAANEIKVLVSTSVIEVGIDVPNATIMMIEGADRFGLAQLHQFRGRVGRGAHQSFCYIFTSNNSLQTRQRLNYFVECSNGFDLAEKDLELRGAGEVYGVRQSGMEGLSIATLGDVALIKTCQQAAGEFCQKFAVEEFPEIKSRLEKLHVVLHLE